MSMNEKRDHSTCFTSFLLLLLILCICEQQVCLGETRERTFFGNGYINIAPWVMDPSPTDNELLLRFTFKTSERSGLLLVMTGKTSVDASQTFLVQLQEGSLVIKVDLGIHNVDEHILDYFLNDNQPHTVTIHHLPGIAQFEYRLDEDPVVKDPYASNIDPGFGTSETYFGGIPYDVANETNFIGCLSDILVGEGSNLSVLSNNSELQALDVVQSVGRVEEGCTDPCADRDCGSGSCVARWPDRAFCDCRASRMLGENCSEGVENSVVEFPTEAETYLCYVPTVQPSPGLSNTVSIQLVPPIPSEGTILIGQADKDKRRFNLRLEDNRLIYEDVIEKDVLKISLAANDVLHQVDLSLMSDCSRNCTELLLKTVSEDGNVSVVGRVTSGNSIARSTVFTTVCVGGSLLEVRNYKGRIQRAFFNYNSLLEEQNFCRLEARSEKRSDVITFASTNISKNFMMEKYTLGSARISFQVRVEPDAKGVFFAVKSSNYSFIISIFNADALAIIREPMLLFRTFTGAADGDWHQFEIFTYLNKTEGGQSEIRIRFDGLDHVFTGDNLTPIVASLIECPLLFIPTDVSLFFPPSELPIFDGCLGRFEFTQTAESEIFRPNLDELPRLNPAAFFVDNCFNCVGMASSVECSSGRVCVDRGYNETAECDCPRGFQGPSCQDRLPANPNLENVTCSDPLVPTPRTDPSETTTTELLGSPTSTTLASVPPAFDYNYVIIPAVSAGFLLLMLVAVAVLLGVVYQRRAGVRGFYETNEGSTKEIPMTRYSASLRQLSSEQVTLDKKGAEGGWPLKNGCHSNGGPPSAAMTSSSASNSSSPTVKVPLHPDREKEFYL